MWAEYLDALRRRYGVDINDTILGRRVEGGIMENREGGNWIYIFIPRSGQERAAMKFI